MAWSFDLDKPLYLQIVENIKLKIINGEYPPGERLLSVRELAAEASVNPNTMQKALAELERLGLVYSQRTSGRFITDNTLLLKNLRYQSAQQEMTNYIEHMQKLGFYAYKRSGLFSRQLICCWIICKMIKLLIN